MKKTLEQQKLDLEGVIKASHAQIKQLEKDIQNDKIKKLLGKSGEVFFLDKQYAGMICYKLIEGDVIGLSIREKGIDRVAPYPEDVINMTTNKRYEVVTKEVFVKAANKILIPFKIS